MFDREDALATYSDMYKDAYGVRPRGIDTSSWGQEDFLNVFKELSAVIESNEIERIAREKDAVEIFEAKVAEFISMGAADRKTAIKWLVSSVADHIHPEDYGFICYEFGLPYNYLA